MANTLNMDIIQYGCNSPNSMERLKIWKPIIKWHIKNATQTIVNIRCMLTYTFFRHGTWSYVLELSRWGIDLFVGLVSISQPRNVNFVRGETLWIDSQLISPKPRVLMTYIMPLKVIYGRISRWTLFSNHF